MKKLILITAICALTSCQKEWKCTTTTSIEYDGQTYNSTTTQTVYGKKKEIKAFEEQNTKNSPGYTATTSCK